MSIFERYAPFIQDYIYQNGWDSLRGVQVAAGEVIFDTDDNLLLAASTASGKTEAAFFPILTMLTKDIPSSIGVIYIAPLKALINDQFMRLNDLCREADIPVWHWHGDVSQTHKNKMVKEPQGILQITPESLEAMLMHRHADIARLFGDLRFVVIDEVHSLLRGDRGGQTLCLIERLCRLAGVNPRRIGLSATLGDPEAAGELLSRGTGRKTVIPSLQTQGVRWRLSLEHFYVSPDDNQNNTASPDDNQKDTVSSDDDQNNIVSSDDNRKNAVPSDIAEKVISDSEANDGDEDLASKREDALKDADAAYRYIYKNTKNKKSLIFVNSREECEAVTASLRQLCEYCGEQDRFLIHHGNLSASFRESAEEIMKDEEKYMSTVTTSTLELGIDIGKLERAFQLNAPATVSSFLQRMGRTGRRGQPQEMHFVIREDRPEPRAMFPATVPWQLLQAIALIQLYLDGRWVEPPARDRLPYSLLYHQTMSTLASSGEMRPAALAAAVLKLSPFANISKEDYLCLLKHLLATGQLHKTEEGGLIVGLNGERQVNSFKFYAVFKDNEEYTVRCQSQELGTVVQPPPSGEKLAIAGKVWLVDEVDHKKKTVYVTEVKGKVPAFFGMCPGDIHTRVLEKMKNVIESTQSYPYVKKSAAERLEQVRSSAQSSNMLSEPLMYLGGDTWCLFPWLGTYAFLALERFIKLKCADKLGISGFEASRPYFMQFKMKGDKESFYKVLKLEAEKEFDPRELIYQNELPLFDKYDEFLPAELVRKGFACSVLDIKGMKSRVLDW